MDRTGLWTNLAALTLLATCAGGRAVALRSEAAAVLRTGASVEVPVLMYHRISEPTGDVPRMVRRMTVRPEQFKAHMQALREEGFTAITFDDLAEHFHEAEDLPPKPVIVSFDDGYKEHAHVAATTLKDLGMVGSFFVNPMTVGWGDFMTWEDVRTLAQMGMEIGSHALTHRSLTALSDHELRDELSQSKRIIEEKISEEVDVLAFPYGDTDERVQKAAREAGYVLAAGVDKGVMQSSRRAYNLKRIEVGLDMSVDQLRAIVDPRE